jgi:hypothetical protein
LGPYFSGGNNDSTGEDANPLVVPYASVQL